MLNNRSKMSTFLVLVATMLMLLQGCAAVPPEVPLDDVWALSPLSTLYGAQSVVSGTLRVGIALQKGNFLCIMWPIKDMGWASIFIDTTKLVVISDKKELLRVIGQAGIFNSSTMGDFTLALKSNGFVEITASQVPAFVASALSSVRSYPVLVLPAGLYKYPSDLMPVEIKQ